VLEIWLIATGASSATTSSTTITPIAIFTMITPFLDPISDYVKLG